MVLGNQLSPWRNEWAGRLPRAYGIFIDGPVFPQVRRYLNNPPTTIQQARKASSAAVESFNAEPATRLVLWVGESGRAISGRCRSLDHGGSRKDPS